VRNRTADAIAGLAAAGGLLAGVGIAAWAAWDDSRHTGVDPWLALVLFVPVAVAGLAHVAVARRWRLSRRLGLLALAVGGAGIGLLLYLDRTDALLQYEVWIERGMP